MTEPIAHTLRGAWTAVTQPLPSRVLRGLCAKTGLSPVPSPAHPPVAPGVQRPADSPVRPAANRPVGAGARLVVPPSQLPAAAQTALAAIVGAENVLVDGESRLDRSSGLSYLDLLRHRGESEFAVSDAVVLPADPAQVASVVAACDRFGIAVVPFGGGTSVVGGVAAVRGDAVAVVAVDVVGLDRLVSVDPVSRLAVLQAGVRGPDAERLLATHGFTLGHIPQSFERATIGGFAATRSAGQASCGYGRFEDMVVGVRVATPRGEWRLGVAPASAAGPDLRALVVGSEGAFGIITEVTVRVRPTPTQQRYEAYVIDGWSRGVDTVRALAQSHALATVTRLSDMDETGIMLAASGSESLVQSYLRLRGVREPCLLVLGWEAGGFAELMRFRAATRRVLRSHRLVRLGQAPGKAWLRSRFGGPRQRDALLDVGVCVETLETATYWSSLTELRDAVRVALSNALTTSVGRPIVMCHVSHAYETGASLYFTVLTPRSADDPIGQWQRAKAAACQAITGEVDGRQRGTITHHHAVGVDHAPYVATEIGELGMDVLAAVKRTLDPNNILNPTKLIP